MSEIRFSAANRALALPEILEHILTFINADTFSIWTDFYGYGRVCEYGCTGVLLRCSLVNKFWNNEAMRVLWSDLQPGGLELARIIDRISPPRRQIYANYIKTAFIHTLMLEWSCTQQVFNTVIFPKIHKLRLELSFFDPYTDSRDFRFPAVCMPNVEILEIRSCFCPLDRRVLSRLERDLWDVLIQQVPVRF